MVSVIIPNYNRSELVCKAVQSIIAQTYKDIEIIVVDDGSTDDSVEKIKSIKDNRLHVIRLEKNGGACTARNEGIIRAKGDYISFLDSDDQWIPVKLEKQIAFMESHDASACFSSYWFIGQDGKKEVRPQKKVDAKDIYSRLLIRNLVTTGTLLARKSVFEDCKFDTRLSRYQDWDMALQIASKYKFEYIAIPLLTMYDQKISITNSTSVEKKLASLKYLYLKYQNDIEKSSKAKSQFLWTIAMYSFCLNSRDLEPLKDAVESDSTSIKKRMVLILSRAGFGETVAKFYRRNH